MNEGLPELSVEIIDLECFKYPCISPVLEKELLFDKWDIVLLDIISEVDMPGIAGSKGVTLRARTRDG